MPLLYSTFRLPGMRGVSGYLPVDGVAKAPVTAVVQPVIKNERPERQAGRGQHAGLCTAHV